VLQRILRGISMPTYETRGPDPDGDYFVVVIETRGDVYSETSLDEVYRSREDAQTAAVALNSRR